jgi:hypothetical protein
MDRHLFCAYTEAYVEVAWGSLGLIHVGQDGQTFVLCIH